MIDAIILAVIICFLGDLFCNWRSRMNRLLLSMKGQMSAMDVYSNVSTLNDHVWYATIRIMLECALIIDLLELCNRESEPDRFRLTTAGWARVQKLQKKEKDKAQPE